MKNHNTNSRPHFARARALAVLAGLTALTSCGSGWALLSTGSSSSSSTPALAINTRSPALDAVDAEPSATITFDFNREVEPTTVQTGPNTSDAIRLFDSTPIKNPSGAWTNDRLSELVENIVVAGKTVTLDLKLPLGLSQKYYVRFEEGVITDLSGRPYNSAEDWDFEIRGGQMQLEQLVTFLQPIGAARYTSPNELSTAVVIEGRDLAFPVSNFVIAVAFAPSDEEFGVPVVIKTNNPSEQPNQCCVDVSNDGQMSVAWTEGRTWGPNNGEVLQVAQSTNDWATWDVTQIDMAIENSAEPHRSWGPRQAFNDVGDSVNVWWAWFESAGPTEPGFANYNKFRVVAATRSGGIWEPAMEWAPPAGREFGWPFVAKSPDGSRVYALWGEATTKPRLYDADPLVDGELCAYWLATYEVTGASGPVWTQQAIAGLGPNPNLPRPTSFCVAGNGKGVITARSEDKDLDGAADAGPRVFVVDLENAGGPMVLNESTYVDPGGDTLAVDPISAPNGFPFSREALQDSVPIGRPILTPDPADDSKIVVAWFASTSSPVTHLPELLVNEYDVDTDTWEPKLSAHKGPMSTPFTSWDFRGPIVSVDEAGSVTLVWSVEEGGYQTGGVYASRRAAGENRYDEIACDTGGVPTLCPVGSMAANRTFLISEDTRCMRYFTADVHRATGRMLVGWNEEKCGTGMQLGSFFRTLK